MSKCPYCLSDITDNNNVVVCEACGAAHHVECWQENGGCCVRNCSKVSRHIDVEVDAEPDTVLVLSRESVEEAANRRPQRNINPCMNCGRQVPEGELYCPDCVPEIQENQDAKNVGPLLIMLLIVVLAIGWIAVTYIGSQPAPDRDPSRSGIRMKVDR